MACDNVKNIQKDKRERERQAPDIKIAIVVCRN